MTNSMIILGNGFSIGLIDEIKKKYPQKKELQEINLNNLFENGDKFPCPWDTNDSCFLSYKNCPNLWILGARPDINNQKANQLISDIVTCANAYLRYKDENLKKQKNLTEIGDKIYLKAYCELVEYIKALMIYYNSLIDDTELGEFLLEDKIWNWGEKFKRINPLENKITIVTYNYDLWLERILKLLKIDFDKLDNNKAITILKPHGSIDFVSECDVSPHFQIDYNLIDPYEYKNLKIELKKDRKGLLIPPAGESMKAGNWAKSIRENAIECAKELKASDKLIICGISYWNVDRYEIDSLLCSVSNDVRLEFINPFPPSEFNATLMTIFKDYTLFKSSTSFELI